MSSDFFADATLPGQRVQSNCERVHGQEGGSSAAWSQPVRRQALHGLHASFHTARSEPEGLLWRLREDSDTATTAGLGGTRQDRDSTNRGAAGTKSDVHSSGVTWRRAPHPSAVSSGWATSLMTAEAARRIRGRRPRRGSTVYETPSPEHEGPWSACAE